MDNKTMKLDKREMDVLEFSRKNLVRAYEMNGGSLTLINNLCGMSHGDLFRNVDVVRYVLLGFVLDRLKGIIPE